MKRRFEIDDFYFDKIDTQEKAYILGLLTADGCNYENDGKVKIDLIRQDEYILYKIKEELKFEGSIHQYKDTIKSFKDENGKYRDYECQPLSRLLFNSKHISETLAKMGCISNKSLNGNFLNGIDKYVPSNLFNHYIRGLMDGNGGISYWEDNPNTHHLKFQINYCGTSNVVKDLADFFKNKFGCYPAISDRWPERDNNNLQMNICGNKIVKSILDWLYCDATIYLERKYIKYIKLIEERDRVENDTKLYGNAHPRKKVIYIPTNTIYDSVSKAAKSIGVTTSTISNRCKSKLNKEWDYYLE